MFSTICFFFNACCILKSAILTHATDNKIPHYNNKCNTINVFRCFYEFAPNCNLEISADSSF